MLRHPAYLLLCATGCCYLFWSNARGWTPFYFAKTQASRFYSGPRFFHK